MSAITQYCVPKTQRETNSGFVIYRVFINSGPKRICMMRPMSQTHCGSTKYAGAIENETILNVFQYLIVLINVTLY